MNVDSINGYSCVMDLDNNKFIVSNPDTNLIATSPNEKHWNIFRNGFSIVYFIGTFEELVNKLSAING